MTGRNKLKARIKAGETVAAAWLDLGSPDVAELLVHAGWDVIVVDCEHGAAGLEDGFNLIRAVEAAGGEAILRVPDASEAVLKRALDRGARSLMVPMVHSAKMAQGVADCCLYPPRGQRGYAAPIVRASGFGAMPDFARERAHEELLLMVQIEHVDAVSEIPAIAAIDGIDMVFVGPNDLAASMGYLERMDTPEVLDVVNKAEELTLQGGLSLGTVLWPNRNYRDLQQAGYRLIVGPCDVAMLANAAREARTACLDMLG
ncbi:MAG: aldolase [Rhodobacteraceae bacterium]|nr:aldolase [Paracoccaceae bacterium]